MRSVTAVSILSLLVKLTMFLFLVHAANSERSYVGSIPPGISIPQYLQTCTVCGEMFGTEYSSRCVSDKTFVTYYTCVQEVHYR